MDGYEPRTKTVFQYHGCHWHGCPAHCKQTDARDRVKKTRQQEHKIKAAGYTLLVVWECDKQENVTIPEPQIVVYPHAIVYDFEAYLDKTKRYKHTKIHTWQFLFQSAIL